MIKPITEGWQLALYLQPNASRTAIVGLHQHYLKIAISAPALAGKANSQLIQFLAQCFQVPKSAVLLEKGQQSRIKKVKIISDKPLPESLSQWLIHPLAGNDHA